MTRPPRYKSDATPPTAADASLDLDRSLVQGVAWTAGLRWGAQIFSWASTLIVARLLTPADYGLLAMATVVLGLITLVSQFGLGAAIIKERHLTEHQIAQVHGLCVGFGGAAFALGVAAAYPLARFYDAPELVAVVAVLSVNFLITSFRTVPLALLQRDLQFKRVATNDVIQAGVLAVAMVVFAVLGFRYWTLVLGAIMSAVISTVLARYQRPSPIAWPRIGEIREATRLGGHVMGSNIGWYVYQNADFLIAGKVLGPAAVGAYSLGWTLASIPVEKVSAMVGRVTPGFFSAVQDDSAALRRYLLNLSSALGLVTFPAAVGLGLVAPTLVPLFLGEKWVGAIVPLQLLAVYATYRSITTLLHPIAVNVGLSGFAMRNSFFGAVLMPVAFLIGSRWGTTGIAAAWIVAYPIVTLPMYRAVFRRIDMRVGTYLAALWPSLSSVAIMSAGVILAGRAMPSTAGQGVRFATLVAVGALLYAASLLLLHRAQMKAAIAGMRRIG